MPSQFFSSLKTVAGSPYALIAYIVLLMGWVFLSYRRSRLTIIAKALNHIPEKDRKNVLLQDYGIYLKEGMSAQDYLKGQRQTYIFMFLLAVIIMATIITVVALMNVSKISPLQRNLAEQPDSSLCAATDLVMNNVSSDFKAILGKPEADGDPGDYESKFVIPGTDRNSISLNPVLYFAWIYRGGDKTIAFQNYFSYVHKIGLCKSDWVVVPGITNQAGNRFVEYTSYVKNDHKLVIGVKLDKDSLYTTVLMAAKNENN